MEKISEICENLYSKLLEEIPQTENGEILWILNGSVLCNILANVEKINDKTLSNDLKKKFKKFVRVPKGDIDICYKADRPYKFDLTSSEVHDFYLISEEIRTYNFVDSNSELSDEDIKQLCKYRTTNGLEFYAKMPQYIFMYKFKEFVSMFHDEILNRDLDSILLRRKNIIRDASILYEISIEYFGLENTNTLLFDHLKETSSYFYEQYENSKTEYKNIIDKSLEAILPFEHKKTK